MEGRQSNFTNNGKTITEEAMLLSNQMTGQMVNHPSAKQLVFVKQKKFGKKTFIGLAIALLLVLTTSLGFFYFLPMFLPSIRKCCLFLETCCPLQKCIHKALIILNFQKSRKFLRIGNDIIQPVKENL